MGVEINIVVGGWWLLKITRKNNNNSNTDCKILEDHAVHERNTYYITYYLVLTIYIYELKSRSSKHIYLTTI